MGITVKELLNAPFLKRTQVNKIQIVSEGKPRPLLNMSAVTMSDDGEIKTETFDPVIYDQVPWLTGCDADQSFYCWSCLLFTEKRELWKMTDLAFLSDGISEHEKADEHIRAALGLKTFSSEHLKVNLDDSHCNIMLRKNREIMKLLIDALCSIVAGVQPFPGSNSYLSQIKPEMCLKALNLLKLCNNRLFNNFKDVTELIKITPTLVDDLVDAMTKVVKLAVMTEARMSTFVALIISDHSTIRTKSHFSVILRYIKNGKVCERFLGFITILASKSTSVIYDIIRSTIQALESADKFLAYSFDGGVLDTGQLTHLNGLLQNQYPQSYFVPCYFHGIQHILQQSLSVNTELTEFFKILTMMEAYFQEASDHRKLLERFMFLNISRENSEWYVNATFIKIVFKCRKHFIEALKSIIKNCTQWSADDNIKARVFLEFLERFHTVFLLTVLSSLFELIVPLDEAMRNSMPEMEFRHDIVVNIMHALLCEITYFQKYFDCAIQEMESAKLKVNYSNQTCAYHSLHITIINIFEKEIRLRFLTLDKLNFCSLVNMHLIGMRRKELALIYWHWKSKLYGALGHQFSSDLFESEVNVQCTNKIFEKKNAYDLLNCFKDPDLKNIFQCTNRLLEFTLTMPFKPPTQDGVSSKFEKIKRFSYPTGSIKTYGDACVLHVESDILRELQSDVFFYDDVIQKLYEVNKTLMKCLDGHGGE